MISKINSQINNFQSFGTARLFKIKLKNCQQDSCNTYISMLVPSDKNDIKDAKELFTENLGDIFFREFNATLGNENSEVAEFARKNNKFVLIEKDGNQPLKNRIVSYCYATVGSSGIHIQALNSVDPKIGAGSCILYILSKIAQIRNCFHITALSKKNAIDFYKQYQFSKEKNNCDNFLELVSQYYVDLQNLLEEKYQIIKIANLDEV